MCPFVTSVLPLTFFQDSLPRPILNHRVKYRTFTLIKKTRQRDRAEYYIKHIRQECTSDLSCNVLSVSLQNDRNDARSSNR